MAHGIPKIRQFLNELSDLGIHFLTYETEFVLFLAVLENAVLPMGWDSSHGTLKVRSKF